MSGAHSRRKGATGELELARFLSNEGFPASRGQQHRGGPGSPDVLCSSLPVHWEAKRCERLRLYDALAQAGTEAGDDEIPVVAHRRNRYEWVAVLRLTDLLAILRESSFVKERERRPSLYEKGGIFGDLAESEAKRRSP